MFSISQSLGFEEKRTQTCKNLFNQLCVNKIMTLERCKRRITIESSDLLGIHSLEVIRLPGGGKTPLDDIARKMRGKKVKAIGIPHTGFYIPGSEFVETKYHHGIKLPMFGSDEGVKRIVFAILDENPRVYKIPRNASFEENKPTIAKMKKALAGRISEAVPAATFHKLEVMSEVEFHGAPRRARTCSWKRTVLSAQSIQERTGYCQKT
jgi:hypothetical protein